MRSRQIASLGLSCVLMGGSSAAAFAQVAAEAPAGTAVLTETESAGRDTTGEIVVTAQKRTQRLLDVPVAVSAVSSEALVTQNLVSIRDYASRIPGIQLSGPDIRNLSLRGVSAGGNTSPTVAVLIDDVQYGSSTYLGSPPIPDLDPGTLERVEVLRGPQGTLYGASSLGGLVKYVTRSPDTESFSGRVEIGANTVEDGGQGFSARGSINLPIIADRVALSLSGFYRDDPRYQDFLGGGRVVANGAGAGGSYVGGTRVEDGNKATVYGGRAALLAKVTDNLTVIGSALRQKTNLLGSRLVLLCSTCYSVNANGSTTLVGGPVTFGQRYSNLDRRSNVAANPPSSNDIALYTGRVELALDKVKFTSVSAWGRNVVSNVADTTSRFGPALLENPAFGPAYAPGATYLFSQPIKTTKFTQEVRAETSGPVVDVLAGGFYTKEHSNLRQTIIRTGTAAADINPYDGQNISSYEEIAGFGDVTVHATDKLDVQLGGRYAHNKQLYDVVSIIDLPAQAIFGPGELEEFRSSESAFTWLVTPSYRFNPDLLAYVRVATGYRPGGPNTQTPGAPRTYGNDKVLNYEAGLKGYALDRAVSFDLSVFQIDWKDIQLQNTALPSQFVFIANGKKARSRGIEATTTIRPWRGMSIDANGTLLDATLIQSLDRSSATVQRLRGDDGDRLPFSSKVTANLSVQQDFPLADSLSAYAGFNVNYIGNRYGQFNQDSARAVFPRVKLPAYTVVDLRAGVSIDKRWNLNLYLRNLFDRYGLISIDTRGGVALPEGSFITPRTFGFTVSGTF